jgi:hypothetical protein
MSTLLSRLRGCDMPTLPARREALLYAAADEELTPLQISRLHEEYAFNISTGDEFDQLFTSLRELVGMHRDLRDYGDEQAIAFYATTDRDEALSRCEDDVFEVLDRLVPPRKALTVVGVA